MTDDECKYPNCEKPARGSDAGAFGGKFCSPEHELKYEHLREDARQARMDNQREPHHDDVPRGYSPHNR